MFSPFAVFALALLLGQGAPAPAYQHLGATPPPHGLPAIVSYTISSTDIRAGQTVTGAVETSENVVYAEARVDYRESALKREGPGRFALSYTVPWWLPPWLRHAYTLQIVARTADGVETRREIPIRIR